MKKLIGLLRKIDDNIVRYLVTVYIFFIPLFPKIPIRPVYNTYIAVRVDDIFIGLIIGIFCLQIIRKKIKFNFPFFFLFLLFWGAVFLSLDYGIFIAKNISKSHDFTTLGVLNALRRIQYMLPFFIGYSTIKSEKDFLFYMKTILITISIVCVYGIGQKFLGWPAIQTMNPEYSRGHLLILTPEARVSSTFAGHYDLAAYLILLLPIVYGFYFFRKKVIYICLFVLALFTMILTASRVSFGAYIISLSAFLLFIKKYKHLAFVIVLTIAFTFMNNNLTSRIKRTFQIKRIFVNEKTGQVVIPQRSTVKELPAGTFYIPIQGGSATQAQIILDQKLAREKILSDIRADASRSGRILTRSEEELIFASISAGLRPISTIVSDISFATRLQVEWPRAIAAFIVNPIFGTGVSSITEATDNDYLRWLGETGLLGTGLFVFILFSILKLIYINIKKMRNEKKYIYYGFIFGFIGLLINAAWIDVFEASKVAYTFWLLCGFFVASVMIIKNKYEKS